MAYSTAFSQAISILLVIHAKMEELRFEFISTKVIAECLKIPAPTVVKILKNLNDSGITMTKEGSKGGILLAKPITDITLLDVFLAIEHETPMFKTQIDYIVEHEKVDAIKSRIASTLLDAEKAMKASLEKKTVADLYYLT